MYLNWYIYCVLYVGCVLCICVCMYELPVSILYMYIYDVYGVYDL